MEIKTGVYTIQQILDASGLVVDDAFDRRRIKVGGLGFDSTSETLRVVGDELAVTLDEVPHKTFTVIQ